MSTLWRTRSTHNLAGALTSVILASALSLLVLGPLLAQVTVGWSGGDLLSTYMNAEMWQGFRYGVSDQFGFPLGMNLNYFPGIDITENLFAQVVTAITGQPFSGINLLIVVSFPLTAFFAYFLVRLTGIGVIMSVTGSLVITFLPYHFGRALGHTYLSTMYSLVTGLILVLLIGSGRFTAIVHHIRFSASRKSAIVWIGVLTLLVLVTAWTGVYYAAFTLILGVAAVLWRFTQGDTRSQLLWSVVPLVGILVIAAVGFLPSMLTVINDPPLAILSERLPYESVIFAGLLTVALLPLPLSNLPGMGFYNRSVIEAIQAGGSTEASALSNYGTWVTTAALVTFLVGVAVMYRRRQRSATPTQEHPGQQVTAGFLGYLMVVTTLFFIPWGLNYVVAGTLTAQIRAWNRMAPVLLILFILGAAVVLRRTSFATRPLVAIIASVAIVGITAVDSIMPFRSAYAESVKDGADITHAAREYAMAVNAVEPADCGVLQIPITTYPEFGPVGKFNDYDHFWVSLLNPEKKWSYGAVRNTAAAMWSAQLPMVPTAAQFSILVAGGFCGVHVDTRAFNSAERRDITTYISTLLGEPVATGFNGDWLYYSLDSVFPAPSATVVTDFFGQPLITPDPTTTQPRESELDQYWWWSKEPSTTFTLTPQNSDTRPVTTITGSLISSPCGPRSVDISATAAQIVVDESLEVQPDNPTEFTLTVPTTSPLTITFTTDSTACTGSDFTWQRFLQIQNLRTYN